MKMSDLVLTSSIVHAGIVFAIVNVDFAQQSLSSMRTRTAKSVDQIMACSLLNEIFVIE